ncbi:MAG: CHAD domain-containing protein [Pseudomonadota bacterium]
MAFRFALNRPLAHGFVTLAVGELQRCDALLSAAIDHERQRLGKAAQREAEAPDETISVGAVHETRKALKRTRALLRLMRSGMPREAFKALNGLLARAGRAIAVARDAHVLAQTMARFDEGLDAKGRKLLAGLGRQVRAHAAREGERAPAIDAMREARALVRECGLSLGWGPDEGTLTGQATKPVDQRAARGSAKRATATGKNGAEGPKLVACAEPADGGARGLERALQPWCERAPPPPWLPTLDLAVAARGFGTSYARAKKAMAVARASGVDTDFHEWRKFVQHHWRQLQVLRNAWPDAFAARIALARQVSQALGEDHDLYVLRGFAHAQPEGKISAKALNFLDAHVAARQEALRAQAVQLGLILFAVGRRASEEALQVQWRAARKLAGTEQSQAEPLLALKRRWQAPRDAEVEPARHSGAKRTPRAQAQAQEGSQARARDRTRARPNGGAA